MGERPSGKGKSMERGVIINDGLKKRGGGNQEVARRNSGIGTT